jgi:hypothetical protein
MHPEMSTYDPAGPDPAPTRARSERIAIRATVASVALGLFPALVHLPVWALILTALGSVALAVTAVLLFFVPRAMRQSDEVELDPQDPPTPGAEADPRGY